MRNQFLTGQYKDDGIIAYARDTTTKKEPLKILGFPPYFFVPSTAIIPNHPAIKSIEQGFKGLQAHPLSGEEPLTKITMRTPTDVKIFRYEFNTHYEADIPFVRRFLIDTNIKSGFEISMGKKTVNYKNLIPNDFSLSPLICFLDIEVYTKIRFPNPRRKEEKIILITVYDNKNKRYITLVLGYRERKTQLTKDHLIIYVMKERDLLQLLNAYLSQISPDVVSGWNIDFDINYIVTRAAQYGIKFPFKSRGICPFDLLGAYKILNKKGSNQLRDVLYEEGIAKRIGYEPFKTEFWEAEDKTRGILANKSHVEGCVEIDNIHRLVQFFWDMKNLAGLEDMGGTLYHGVIVDTRMLREYHNKWVLPSKPSKEEIKRREKDKLAGAMTFKPDKGLFEGVAVFDATRYYQNIVIGYNLTPEPTDGMGITPKICIDLLKERDSYDKLLKESEPGSEEYFRIESKRNSVKYVAESVIGYFGSPRSRLYNPRIFQKVTITGQKGVKCLKEYGEKLGYKVVYGDTDGIFVKVGIEESKELGSKLNERLKEFSKKEGIGRPLTLKIDRYFDWIIFTGVKKRYAGHVILEGGKPADYYHIVGFEYVRSDSSKVTKQVQHKVFDCILSGRKEEVTEYLENTEEKMRSGGFVLEDITINKTLSKKPEDYGKKGVGVIDYARGSIYANKYLNADIRKGDKVKMVYVKDVPGYPKTDVICFLSEDTLPVKPVINYDKMIDRTIRRKVKSLLEIVGIGEKEKPVTLGKKLVDFL